MIGSNESDQSGNDERRFVGFSNAGLKEVMRGCMPNNGSTADCPYTRTTRIQQKIVVAPIVANEKDKAS